MVCPGDEAYMVVTAICLVMGTCEFQGTRAVIGYVMANWLIVVKVVDWLNRRLVGWLVG